MFDHWQEKAKLFRELYSYSITEDDAKNAYDAHLSVDLHPSRILLTANTSHSGELSYYGGDGKVISVVGLSQRGKKLSTLAEALMLSFDLNEIEEKLQPDAPSNLLMLSAPPPYKAWRDPIWILEVIEKLYPSLNKALGTKKIDLSQKNDKMRIESLLASANQQTKKYAFLDLYRILENDYLIQTLNDINKNFLRSPLSTMKDAHKRLQSECRQIITISEQVDTSGHFVKICDLIEESERRGSTYCAAVKDKALRDYKQHGSMSKAQIRGAMYVYAIRCSIVHAGEKDIIYDYYDDANACISDILEPLSLASAALLSDP